MKLINFELFNILYTFRDVTDSVSAAMTKEQAAEKMMYKSAFANGITTDSTVKDALKTLAGWEASTPAEVVAEYFQIGKFPKFLLKYIIYIIQYKGEISSFGFLVQKTRIFEYTVYWNIL